MSRRRGDRFADKGKRECVKLARRARLPARTAAQCEIDIRLEPSGYHAARIDQPRKAATQKRAARTMDVEPDVGGGGTRGQEAARDALASATRSLSVLAQAGGHFVQPATLHAAPPRDASSFRLGSEQIGAGEGIRTLDPNLGKVVLYP